jgi:hypothetical protein
MSVTFWAEGEEGAEVNFANRNARVVLGMLGLGDEDLCGGLEGDELAALRRKLVEVLNVQERRKGAVREASVTGGEGTGQCMVVDAGNEDSDTVRRLKGVQEVVVWAQDRGLGIGWG